MTKKKVQNLLKHLVCILLCLTVILPFYMVVINSFKSKGEASRMSLALPKEWLFSNYTEVIDKGNLIQGFSNSLLYALVATTLGVVLCAMAAFVMCRKRTRLNVFLYYFVLCGLFFPVNYVTLVRVLSTLHLNDTRQGIIMVFTSAMIPFCVFTIRNFVVSVPVELDEAAVIDGAGPIRRAVSIILPLAKEQLIVCSIITVIGAFKLFTEVYSTTVGGPGNASQVLGLFLYQNAFLHDDMGMAAATGVLIFVITVTASIFQLKVSRSGEI